MNMGKIIPPSELILHPDGSIYHLNIRPEQLAETIILVGDPGRVEIISGNFDTIEYKTENREIKTHTGSLKNKRITVMSTGMGTDNIDIVMNELDALVNIDLETRMIKENHTSLTIFRVGTSGSVQSDVPVNSFVLSEYGLGLDGLMGFYKDFDKFEEKEIEKEFISQSGWPENFPKPYAVRSSEFLFDIFNSYFITGITATAPGFYAPQGRRLRLPLAFEDLTKVLENFSFKNKRIINFEMETSALYGLSKLLGHQALTMCIAIANRKKHDFNQDYKKSMEKLIELLLVMITSKLP
jgi:uridine phosphorylase